MKNFVGGVYIDRLQICGLLDVLYILEIWETSKPVGERWDVAKELSERINDDYSIY